MRMFLRAFLALALGFAFAIPAASATKLGDLAAQMVPGEWRVLNQAGDGSGIGYDLYISCTGTDCADNILNYADKGLWNPNTREIHFLGQGHGGRLMKHISYSEAANKWGLETKPYWDCSPSPSCYSIVHGYEHSTIDPSTGNIYARKFNSTEAYKWSRGTKTWSQLPAAPRPNSAAVAIEYFPELGGVLLAGSGELHLYSEATRSWRALATSLPMADYHNVASYNPVYKIVVFGGGNNYSTSGGERDLHKIDAAGRITKIANPPVNVGVNASVFTVDPASGRYLLFGAGGGFYEYDVLSNSWSTLSSAGVPIFGPDSSNRVDNRVAIPVTSHGVILFLAFDWNEASAKVYVYKHAPGRSVAPDLTPPAAPSGIVVE